MARVGLVQTSYQLDYAWAAICAAIDGEHDKWVCVVANIIRPIADHGLF